MGAKKGSNRRAKIDRLLEKNGVEGIVEMALANAIGIPKYLKTLDTRVIDTKYAKNFAGFYRLRFGKTLQKDFFAELDAIKLDPDITFTEVFADLKSIIKKRKFPTRAKSCTLYIPMNMQFGIQMYVRFLDLPHTR